LLIARRSSSAVTLPTRAHKFTVWLLTSSCNANPPSFSAENLAIDTGGVVIINRARRVKQHCNQVFLDISDFSFALVKTVKDILDVIAVELQQLGFHKLGRVLTPGDTDRFSGCAKGFKHYVHDFVQSGKLMRVLLDENLVLDVVFDYIPVCVNRALGC
jgi:hypothetical protein